MYVALEKLIDKTNGNLYKLVHLVSRRALALAEGAPKTIEAPSELKVTTLAMMEIAQDKIVMVEKEKQA
jgi:DNA-directed RNA polymerase subunit K/omega